ncbi:polysaccharide biosynthesis protein [Caulobacter segnis]|uniref:Polysaccharide biosynthesis protein CapD n=2 Tax=Caulobacter segnis TaxID=88688 RepID=D5VET2_CAUST|nr:nucleoside-diphosphate sugar epimerase/dehydratase [Caulobacter segnis]ADG09225.1 polysaccharide biosynthesis protein CapD [Caulobacter segnis ATCC 21756]AVQ01040.1 polysaccharide biosynthesis protein [Caulobacter segnis]
MGHVGKIATNVLLAFLALLVGRYLVIDMPFTGDTLLQATYYALGALIVELVFRVERAPWRFVSASDHLRLFRSAVLTAAAFMVITRLVHPGIDGGLRTVAGAALIQGTFLSALRVIRRSLHERQLLDSVLRLGPASMHPALPRLLIVGSAAEAEAFLRAPAGLGERYTPIGVVSPQDRETGDELRGVCVLGAIADFDRVLARLRDSGLPPSAILFLTDSAMSTFGAERLGRLKAEGVRLLRRHGVVEMGASADGGAMLREISLEELLSRPPVRLDPEPIRALVWGRRVVVTGAGGSIGSELCRQIAASGCAHLTMVDASEYNLFHIDREIAERHPLLPRREILCDVRDAARVERVFAEQKPDIVFHAAALKHVTLVENHPCEGVRTNVLGTRNVAVAAKACGAAHLALISTDKAVAPTSIMGAAKRVAEAVARQYGGGGDMRVSIVRFGNVLGSAGSVVPIFQSQIARGGPITLTDANVERYFMTIPEAVQLVLRAVALSMIASDGDEDGVLTLEMGEPVKIIDLAKRMIELQGLVPERDIEIKITGLRPGEKLTETLVDVNEVARAKAPGIMEAVRMSPAPPIADARLETLDALAEAGDEAGIREELFALVESLRQTGPSKVVKIRAS